MTTGSKDESGGSQNHSPARNWDKTQQNEDYTSTLTNDTTKRGQYRNQQQKIQDSTVLRDHLESRTGHHSYCETRENTGLHTYPDQSGEEGACSWGQADVGIQQVLMKVRMGKRG